MKDNQYWKEYNSKRREYFRQRYLQQKEPVVNSSPVVKSGPVVKSESLQPQVILQPSQVVNKPKILQPKPSPDILQPSLQPQLWSDYYSCKKPFCLGCIKKGISSKQYAFCSLAKDTTDPDFPNIYFCQVYHWTVYQGRKNC